MAHTSHNYSGIAKRFNLPSIESLHRFHDTNFVQMYTPWLSSEQGFNFQSQTQNIYSTKRNFILEEIFCRSNDTKHSHRIRHSCNNLDDSRGINLDSNLSANLQSWIYSSSNEIWNYIKLSNCILYWNASIYWYVLLNFKSFIYIFIFDLHFLKVYMQN